MSRSLALGSVLSLVVAGLGCHGATSAPAPGPRSTQVEGMPNEMRTPSAATVEGTSDPNAQASPQQAAATPTKPTTTPPTVPPETAPNAPSPDGFKPHDEPDKPPSAIGGGPKNVGGAVYGEGGEGNTGANPGGETPPPKK